MRFYFVALIITSFVFSCQTQNHLPDTSTASKNVKVIEEVFMIKGLSRERQIRVYVPDNYNNSQRRYAVLYMHDGQNLFDVQTSYAGEWGVDETLTQLKLNLIVVGIDNGGEKRMNEMGPWDHLEFGESEAREYLDFIVHQVKPYIDSIYRTAPERENTGIMGSSMGGLISHYGIYKYPQIFSKAGIFSPSYWYSEQIFTFSAKYPLPYDSRLFINVGGKEGRQMEKPAKRMAKMIVDEGHPESNIYFENVSGGAHGETFWREEFGKAVRWLFPE